MPNRIRRWFFDQVAAWCVLFRRRDLALEYYGKMLELDPDDPLALASIAFQTAQQGRKREALAMFDRLLAVTARGCRGALQPGLPAAGDERPRGRHGGVRARDRPQSGPRPGPLRARAVAHFRRGAWRRRWLR